MVNTELMGVIRLHTVVVILLLHTVEVIRLLLAKFEALNQVVYFLHCLLLVEHFYYPFLIFIDIF